MTDARLEGREEEVRARERRPWGYWRTKILLLMREKGCASVREIYEALDEKPSMQTLYTVLKRLAKEGVLKRIVRGFYCYEPEREDNNTADDAV